MTRHAEKQARKRAARRAERGVERGARAAYLRAGRSLEDIRAAMAMTGGDLSAAAKLLGMKPDAVRMRLARAAKAEAAAGPPEQAITRPTGHPAASPYDVVRRSVFGDHKIEMPDGSVQQVRGWEIQKLNPARQREMNQAWLSALLSDIPPFEPVPYRGPSRLARALLNLYVITDAHIGAYCSQEETGAAWSHEKAERTIWRLYSDLFARAPAAHHCVIGQLGDFYHWDGLTAVTPQHRHILDASGRRREVARTGVRILRRVVDHALATHRRVTLVVAEGNHDEDSSFWLRDGLIDRYRDEPRLRVLDHGLPYYALRHGQVFLGFHHGHKKKPQELPGHFCDYFAPDWGRSVHRFIHCGHRHHARSFPLGGAQVVQHAALAPNDAHAARLGYPSRPEASVVTYHAQFGYRGALSSTPEMAVGPNWRSAA